MLTNNKKNTQNKKKTYTKKEFRLEFLFHIISNFVYFIT